ncbi:MAG: VOC family protein [Bacteroidales bacterium]|nr:VOC family protein [Candidatus Cryptobacteroides caccocaballi]
MTDPKLIRPQRPKITGIAHFSVLADDLENTAAFFSDYFGYAKPYYVEREGKPTMMFVKINDRQYVEITKDDECKEWKYRHTAFEVDDIEAMRMYLRMMGVKVPDDIMDPGFGFKCFFIKDFSGHDVEFVQYIDSGLLAEHMGQDMPDTRISDLMRHVGWLCDDFSRDLAFYSFILGFKEFWRGGPDDNTSKWIKLAMPDSPDREYIEIMLYDQKLDQTEMGCQNHIGLDVDDVPAARAILESRRIPEGCTPGEPMKIGACGYGQSNYLTLDKTRVEIMTREAVGGKPTPPIYGIPARYEA